MWRINRHFGWALPSLPLTGSSDQHEIEVFLKKSGKTGRAIFQGLRAINDEAAKLQLIADMVAQLAPKSK